MLDFYKLGAAKAAQDVGTWLSSGIDNPTMGPPKAYYAKTAVARMVEKLSAQKRKKAKPRVTEGTTQRPRGKGTRYAAMVRNLKKKKGTKRG